MTDFSAIFHSSAATRPSIKQILGVEIPTIEICDVGAMAEGVDRYSPLVVQGLADVNGFEPDPKQFARLQGANRPRCRYFPVFVGAGGPATFHLARYPGCSSLYEADPGVIDLFSSIGASVGGNFTVTSTEPVQTTRLDDVPELPPIDLLKLDVQGAELDVIKGATRTLENVLVIESEVEFVPLYKDQPLFGDLQVFLRERGFLFHKFLDITGRSFRPFNGPGGNPFTAMSQALWADAIFVRDFSKLDRFNDEQLLKSAAILSEVYFSHDLVSFLLREYDGRRKTQLAQRYAQTVLSQPNLRIEYMTHKIRP
jgi:FkbM family methyltransferase